MSAARAVATAKGAGAREVTLAPVFDPVNGVYGIEISWHEGLGPGELQPLERGQVPGYIREVVVPCPNYAAARRLYDELAWVVPRNGMVASPAGTSIDDADEPQWVAPANPPRASCWCRYPAGGGLPQAGVRGERDGGLDVERED